MPRKFWKVRNATEPGVGDLLIYGHIGSDSGMGWLFDDVTPKQFSEDLDSLGEISILRVFINSEGGDVFAGQAIHSMLRRHPATVSVYVDGLAASIAAVVAMAGDKVIMPRNAMMMVHNPWSVAAGDAEEFRKLADTLDQIRESIVSAYENKTGMDRARLLNLLEAETWMTAQEAVDMGFADEIEEAKQIAASMSGPGRMMVNGMSLDLGQFSNAPRVMMGVDTDKTPAGNGRSYGEQGDEILEALSEYEGRTFGRLVAREKSGRGLSTMDMGRWQQIQDTAERVLGRIANGVEEGSDEQAQAVAVECERLRAIINEMAA